MDEWENELDDDFDMAGYREKRIEEMRQEALRDFKLRSTAGHGELQELADERQVLDVTTKEPKCVVHFFHQDFRRCDLMNKHLLEIAPKHPTVRFCKANVEKCPFLVDRMNIRVLPCVITFQNGVSVDRLVGFEELGNNDNFTTAALELRLKQALRKKGQDLGAQSE